MFPPSLLFKEDVMTVRGDIKSDKQVAYFIADRCKGFEYAGNYTGADGRADIRCIECGTIINRSMISIRKNHFGCPTCNKRKQERLEEEKKRLRYLNQFKQAEAQHQMESRRFNKGKQLEFNVCKMCGELFIPTREGQTYCSAKCSRRLNDNKKWNRRRIKIAEAMVDKDISLQELFKRSNGVCALCGGRCEWNDCETTQDTFIAGNTYPSIDHIVPLSRGGEHSWSNIQLAHRICNSLKSNSV